MLGSIARHLSSDIGLYFFRTFWLPECIRELHWRMHRQRYQIVLNECHELYWSDSPESWDEYVVSEYGTCIAAEPFLSICFVPRVFIRIAAADVHRIPPKSSFVVSANQTDRHTFCIRLLEYSGRRRTNARTRTIGTVARCPSTSTCVHASYACYDLPDGWWKSLN
jgi:hypothetical protein